MKKIIGIYSNDPVEAEQHIQDVLQAGYNQPILFTNLNQHAIFNNQFETQRADNVEQAQQMTIKRFGKRADFGIWEDTGAEQIPSSLPKTVAVVITSHNYGKYLAECIESVLSQTQKANEIIVVDDASTDDTASVTDAFHEMGVKYIRVENRSALLSRHDGVMESDSEVVLFLDADDVLSPDFIECGIKEFTHKNVGVVYSDHQHFGFSDDLTNFPDYSKDRLFQGPNFVSTCSFVRREALLLCDAWNNRVDESFMPEDYWMFQRIALDGWHFKKQKALLNYRRHSESMSQSRGPIDPKEVYYLSHGLQYQTVTLFIPLAGRKWAWDRLSMFLERQNWPHDQIKLILCDTSQDDRFSTMVKYWMSDCDYADVRHFKLNVGTPGLADKNRREREHYLGVKQAICRIYNQLRLMLETPYCWILEDDIIPPDDVLERLLKHFHTNVGAVTAPYQSRFNDYPVVWSKQNQTKLTKPKGQQVSEIWGSGFGCLVTRSEIIKKHLWPIQSNRQDLDPYFFDAIGPEWKRLCDWSCRCEHWHKDDVYLIEE